MTNKNAKRIRQIYAVALSIVIAAVGICLISACVSICQLGEHPFSREVVAEHFAPIAVPVWLCLGMIVVGFLLDWLLPEAKSNRVREKQNARTLQRLHSRIDLSQCDESLRTAVFACQNRRRAYRVVRTCLIVVCAVVFACYALNGSNFGDRTEITPSMIRAMYVLVPCCGVPFAWAVFTAYSSRASIEKEIELLKQAKPSGSPAPRAEAAPKQDHARLLRRVILAIGIVVLAYGFLTGGTADVLTKAVNICTECVGLG